MSALGKLMAIGHPYRSPLLVGAGIRLVDDRARLVAFKCDTKSNYHDDVDHVCYRFRGRSLTEAVARTDHFCGACLLRED